MCGFAGFCDAEGRFYREGKETARKMSDEIRHRGPDSRGEYSDGFLSVGFCRLKITDLFGGDQPMLSEDGRYLICFNGEIYNCEELRAELSARFKTKFRTASDTEVLLYACIAYGRQVLSRLRGMYAFLFYDRGERTVFAARDPFGIKPFYYGFFDGALLFASEIKAMLPHPLFKKEFNSEILPYYLQFQYVPTEETAFKGVKRLMPGHFFTYDGKEFRTEKYFFLPEKRRGKYIPYSFFEKETAERRVSRGVKKSSDRLLTALSESVRLHSESKVPLGAFLSGGVDSGVVCAMARPERAYSVGFSDEGFDERSEARKTAEGTRTDFASVEVTASDFFAALPSVQYYSDEPYANLSAVPLYLMTKRASRDVKVILSGEGADELFGGYLWYTDSKIGGLYRRLPFAVRRFAARHTVLPSKRLKNFAEKRLENVTEDFIGQAKIMTAREAALILKGKYAAESACTDITAKYYREAPRGSALQKKMYLDQNLWLPFDILNKADKMTMASSVELRVPYLDLKVLSVSEGLSDRLSVKNGTTKYLLRRLAEGLLPREAAYRPKKGFPVPLRVWLRDEKYKNILLKTFDGEIAAEFFDTERLKKMLNAHFEGRENNARALYTVYAFLVWYGCFFKTAEQNGGSAEKENKYEENRLFADHSRL